MCIVSSCSPVGRLTRLLDRHPELIDTVRTVTTIYRDTTVYVPVLGTDTVYQETTIRDTLIVHSGTAHGQSWVTHDTLKLMVWQSDTLLKVKLDSVIKIIDAKNTEIITLKHRTKVEKILDKMIVIIALVVFAALTISLIKLFKN
jgi:hypothetical protein